MGRSLPVSSGESLESPGFGERGPLRWACAAGPCARWHWEARPPPGEGQVHKMATRGR